MNKRLILDQVITDLIAVDPATLFRRCRPRLLIVTDGCLSFRENHGFGLWRFLYAISQAYPKPIITLAHRGSTTSPITVGSNSYNVLTSFNFSTAARAVRVTNYDQLWLFGIDSDGSISDAEIGVIAEFMNAGGGVFATGDHADLGKTLCGKLPRIRHMREWQNIPMGIEDDVNHAVQRIDTVVDPGSNQIHEFNDQSDDIPQRIYPHYKVTASGTQWTASIHPVLKMPGGSLNRPEADGSSSFTNDVDVYPDHPHESVCYNVDDSTVLTGNYTDAGLNFREFQPSAASASATVGAEIIASGVSGGRAIWNLVWKPPVTPRMFGVLSVYDGRQAAQYSGKRQRPGRIVCDSTWHHYVNINLDGRGTSRQGLGTWSGGSPGSGTFTASTALNKIYTAYRNMVSWLQPAGRIWCRLWIMVGTIRYHPLILEEIMEAPRLSSWGEFVALGAEVRNVIAMAESSEWVDDVVQGVLQSVNDKLAIGDRLDSEEFADGFLDKRELLNGVLGAMMATTSRILPENDPDKAAALLKEGNKPAMQKLKGAAEEALQMGLKHYQQRLERSKRLFRVSKTK